MSAGLNAGFTDAPIQSQRTFRAIMNALARPGWIQAFPSRLSPPAPLTAELAAVALTLVDHEAPLWLDRQLGSVPEVGSYLRFHTGASIVDRPDEAAFALIADAGSSPDLASFATGTPEYPDRSTTIVFAVRQLANAGGFRLEGPGIPEAREFTAAPLPPGFQEQLSRNADLFPLGLDFLFVAPGRIAGLPRTTRLSLEAV